MNKYEVMDIIDNLIHSNNLKAVLAIGDESGCITHVCSGVPLEMSEIIKNEIEEHINEVKSKMN